MTTNRLLRLNLSDGVYYCVFARLVDGVEVARYQVRVLASDVPQGADPNAWIEGYIDATVDPNAPASALSSQFVQLVDAQKQLANMQDALAKAVAQKTAVDAAIAAAAAAPVPAPVAPASAGIPVYRLQGHGDHFYTTSAAERDSAISVYGYTSEGIAFYALPIPDAGR